MEYYEYGSITGTGVAFNAKKATLTIYKGGKKITCQFPPVFLTDVEKAMGQNVTVTGELVYRGMSKIPYKMTVENIEVHPGHDKLPTLTSLFGMAKEMTGDLSSEEFIARLRTEWK